MKFTLSWLREHLSGDYGLDDVTGALNRIGLQVNERPLDFLKLTGG